MRRYAVLMLLCLFVPGCAHTGTSVKKAKHRKVKKDIYNASMEMMSYYTYEYNHLGKKKKSHYTPAGDLLSSTIYVYKKDGKRTRKTEHGPKGNLLSQTDYIYAASGKRIEKIVMGPNNKLRWRYLYEYDKNGKKTKRSRFYPDGKLQTYVLYESDPQGNMSEKIAFTAKGDPLSITRYAYDRHNRKALKTIQTPDDTLEEIAVYSY